MSALSAAMLLLPFTFNHFVAQGRVLLGIPDPGCTGDPDGGQRLVAAEAGRAPVVPFWVMVLGFMVAAVRIDPSARAGTAPTGPIRRCWSSAISCCRAALPCC
jgi:hypothetical protein